MERDRVEVGELGLERALDDEVGAGGGDHGLVLVGEIVVAAREVVDDVDASRGEQRADLVPVEDAAAAQVEALAAPRGAREVVGEAGAQRGQRGLAGGGGRPVAQRHVDAQRGQALAAARRPRRLDDLAAALAGGGERAADRGGVGRDVGAGRGARLEAEDDLDAAVREVEALRAVVAAGQRQRAEDQEAQGCHPPSMASRRARRIIEA